MLGGGSAGEGGGVVLGEGGGSSRGTLPLVRNCCKKCYCT